MSMRRFRDFVERFPAYKHVPFAVVERRALAVGEVAQLPTWTTEDLWLLTEEYYRILATANPRESKIKTRSGITLSIPEALDHIRQRTVIGQMLMEGHTELLNFILKRMKETGYG